MGTGVEEVGRQHIATLASLAPFEIFSGGHRGTVPLGFRRRQAARSLLRACCIVSRENQWGELSAASTISFASFDERSNRLAISSYRTAMPVGLTPILVPIQQIGHACGLLERINP